MSTALGLPAKVITGFVDQQVNALLDLDARRKSHSRHWHWVTEISPASAQRNQATQLPVVAYSKKKSTIPDAADAASSLLESKQVISWRDSGPKIAVPDVRGRLFPLKPLTKDGLPSESVEHVIQRRGSSRKFAREPISFAQLSTLLDYATRGVPADFLKKAGELLNDLYLIVHSVEDLPSGAYFFQRENKQLELLKEGDFRDRAGYLGLEQELPADASVDFFFLADLSKIVSAFGNRGYRATQLEAGIVGGKIYLAAYAQKLGATGLTFYDDDVVNFFAPHAKGKSAVFLVACGHSMKG